MKNTNEKSKKFRFKNLQHKHQKKSLQIENDGKYFLCASIVRLQSFPPCHSLNTTQESDEFSLIAWCNYWKFIDRCFSFHFPPLKNRIKIQQNSLFRNDWRRENCFVNFEHCTKILSKLISLNFIISFIFVTLSFCLCLCFHHRFWVFFLLSFTPRYDVNNLSIL